MNLFIKHILLIDDDPYVRAFVRHTLNRAGYAVSEAVNGREGLRLYAAERPDCVITDLYMPEKEGLETIQEMRRHTHQAPIIAISGGADAYQPNFLKAAMLLGADSILRKPFTIEELLAQLRSVLPDDGATATG